MRSASAPAEGSSAHSPPERTLAAAASARRGSGAGSGSGSGSECASDGASGGGSTGKPLLLLPTRLLRSARLATATPDRASLVAGLAGGAAYLALACLGLWLARTSGHSAIMGLPNALAVAVLLRARLKAELPFLLACFAASLAAHAVLHLPGSVALPLALADLAAILVVLALTRRPDRRDVQMDHIADLGRFVWAGGLMGPLVGAILAVPAQGMALGEIRPEMVTRFLGGSMAMVLVVPAALLLVDRVRGTLTPPPASPAEQAALLVGGTLAAFLVFNQASYPLIFLIQPVILLHAFRVGSLGSAVHVGAVAVVAGVMTYRGEGPIAAATLGEAARLQLLQALIAANFLTGLPVAAMLAGRDRMMAQLELGKREIDLLARNIGDAVLRFDLGGICTYASPSVREVLGAAPEALLGRNVAAHLHPETREPAAAAFARLLAGHSERERVTYRRLEDGDSGAPVFIEADCAVLANPQNGAPEGVVIAARDVTERVELEQLLVRARRHAEDAARDKSDFLANMSHEIRTPMNGVLGFAELMLQGDLEADQRRFAELIVHSGRAMMMLLNDVLDLSKIESGQFAINRAPVDLAACLGECVAHHRPAAEGKGLALTMSREACPGDRAQGDGDLWVLTDGLRLRQILLNLIGNAVKFTEVGGVRVICRVAGDELCVSVEDSGIGIGPAQLAAIFDPFTQGQSDTARRFGGTGLGLSISRQLAALLGGRIEVESVAGKGSRFTLVLPAVLVPPLRDLAPGPAPVPVTGPVSTEREIAYRATDVPGLIGASRILLVEDHEINRILVTEMLERCGQEVALAHDGHEAIAMVVDSIVRGRPFDLVLMDVQMPGCDGLAATRAIRTEGIGPELLPVIALTADAFPDDVMAAREAGMQAHLAKPVVFAQLARTLQRWLPTRIVEDDIALTCVSALSRSPRLVARWQARRRDTLALVQRALAEGWLDKAGGAARGREGDAHAGQRIRLAGQLHKLAGTAALFDEPALGEAAGALEQALRSGACAAASAALARALVDIATAHETIPAGDLALG